MTLEEAVRLGLTMGDIPVHWQKGQLLDLKRYSDHTFTATLLQDEEADPQAMLFTSAEAAQRFVSWWYGRT